MITIKYKGYRLSAPESFKDASAAKRYRVCNGMGPKGQGFLVPDTMYLLDLSAAGDIHDWMYEYPEGKRRSYCDLVFLENMRAIIDQGPGWTWVKYLRNRRAQKYYWFVQEWGEAHFKGPKYD